jgi:dipeptidyl aminopeptidase/acylaminoacyl peptidase
MTHDDDARLAAWLGDSFDPAPVAALEKAFARARLTSQRRAWIVSLTGGTIARRPASGLMRFSPVLAVMVLIGLLAGALIVGGVLPQPKPAPLPWVDTSASPEPTAQSKPRLYAFMGADGLWVANLDGTGAHAVATGLGGCQGFAAWSPDGTRLLFSRGECGFFTDLADASRLYLTDASGSHPHLLDTSCVSPCLSDYGGVFSSDGRRILFLRVKIIDAPPSATDPVTGKPAQATKIKVLASIDPAIGRVTELGDFDQCDLCGSEWPRSDPRWSPDRTQIVFTWAPTVSPQPGDSPVFVADADRGNVHQLIPAGGAPSWSPDGSRIVFVIDRYEEVTKFEYRLFQDIYTIRPDGTDPRRLTTDEISSNPAWSVDGRIWFTRIPRVDGNQATEPPPQYWVMDADGSHATQLSGPPQPQDLADGTLQPAS